MLHMDSHSIGLVAGIALCLLLSGFFSSAETAFSSVNKIRLKNQSKNGDSRASEVLRLSEDYDTILSTILIGNNITNILSSTLATVVFVGYFGDLGVTLATVVMTVLVLLIGEITPKMYAKQHPERVAMATLSPLRFFIRLLRPFNVPIGWWKKLIGRFIKSEKETAYSDEELITIVEEAENLGGLEAHESELIRSAIEFGDMVASEVITPRTDMVAVQKDATLDEIKAAFAESGFSRLPVYDNDLDDVVGVLHERDFYQRICERGEPLEEVLTEANFVLPDIELPDLLHLLQTKKSHFSMVVDEFGDIMGIVTIEDILEELVGEIWDEHDEAIINIKPNGDGSYTVQGSTELEGFFEHFDMPMPTVRYKVRTVSGWVVQTLGQIPSEGDAMRYDKLDFTVSKVDGPRIKELQLKIIK